MKNCIFCKIANGEEKSWTVLENEHTIAFFDWSVVNKYHTLVIPKKHYKDIFETPTKVLTEIISMIKKITTLYKDKLGIENIQIINSSGSDAQQDVFHIHSHIIPRYSGDKQDIKWHSHPKFREDFDKLLFALKG